MVSISKLMRWLGGLAGPSGAYGAAAPAMLRFFNPAPAPAKGAPLSAEAQAELNARFAEQLAAKVPLIINWPYKKSRR